MSTSAIENNPIQIDLVALANSTGWALSGSIATHDPCFAGNLYLLGYPLTSGQAYEYSYQIITLTSGTVQTMLGTASGTAFTTAQFVHETVTANGSQLLIRATGGCSITNFSIRAVLNIADNKALNTISFSEKTRKWVSFYSYIPDFGMSMFTKLYTGFNGDVYVHESGSDDRNNFYGVQYQSIIQFVDNIQPALPKTFQSLSIQCNELMITTPGGVQTSLGQISELAAIDFVKDFLSDGVSQVAVTAIEGVYAANLNRDMNTGTLENGDVLRGNYMVCELISTSAESLLLYTVNVVSQRSPIGSR